MENMADFAIEKKSGAEIKVIGVGGGGGGGRMSKPIASEKP